MKKRKVIAFISIAIVLVIVAFIVKEVYMSDETKSLRAGPVESENPGSFTEYTVRFYDGGDVNELVHVYLRISEGYDGLNEIILQISHDDAINLDELTLAFPNISSDKLMFLLPTGSWPPMEFGHTGDGKGSIVYIPDFRILGEGSVRMNFHVQNYNLEELFCHIVMRLSKDKGLKTVEYDAETNIEITLPGEI